MRLGAIFFALMISLSPAASATVARVVTFDQKVEQADSIIRGRFVKQVSTLDPSGRWILTYSTFQVQKTYKGFVPDEITIVTPGGTVGSLHQETVGVPSFREGDVNILFIRRDRVGPTILYQDQGAYRLREEDGDKVVVAPVESGLVLIDPQTGRAHSTAEEGVRKLEDFESRIFTVLRGRTPEVKR